MLSTRYFCRWMMPTFAGILIGYLVGHFIIFTGNPAVICSSSKRISSRKTVHYPPKEVHIYRFVTFSH